MPNSFSQSEESTDRARLKSTQISVLQHNCGRRDTAHHTLLDSAVNSRTTLVFIQEPYVFNVNGRFQTLTHPSYYLLLPTSSPSATRPRVVTYVRKQSLLQFSPRFDTVQDSDLQTIDFYVDAEPFTIYHVYNERQQGFDAGLYTVQRLPFELSMNSGPALLLGDFNLHHPLWNGATHSPSQLADSFANWLQRHQFSLLVDLEVVNSKGGTFLRSQETSVIDLVFAKGFRSFHWSDWDYIEATGSDHQAISFRGSVNSRLPSLATLLQPFNVQRAEWEVFDTYLRERECSLVQSIQDSLFFDDLDSDAEMVANEVLNAAGSSIPRLKVSERSKPWWNADLQALRQEMALSLRQFRRTRDVMDEAAYKSIRNRYFKAVREARTTHWETFLQTTPNVYTAYRYIRNKRSNQSKIPDISYKDINGEPKMAKLAREKADAFLLTLFDNSEKASLPFDQYLVPHPEPDPDPPTMRLTRSATPPASRTPEEWPWPELTMIELEKAIKKTQNTAPGEDRLSWPIIRRAFQAIPRVFFLVYSALFEKGVYPTIWKTSIGIILPKPDKEDYSQPRSYRVIALISCMGKIRFWTSL